MKLLNFAKKLNPNSRYHLSTKKVKYKHDYPYNTDESNYFRLLKPLGFWYAFGDSWIQFANYADLKRYKTNTIYIYEVNINNSNLMIINNINKLKRFNKKYLNTLFEYEDLVNVRHVEWTRVKEDYDGIELNPYFKHKDLNLINWYNLVDVPSGCFWGKNIELNLIGKIK